MWISRSVPAPRLPGIFPRPCGFVYLCINYSPDNFPKKSPPYIAVISTIYEGDSLKRDLSYHQGPVWPWLLGLYYDSLKNMMNTEDEEQKEKIAKKIKKLKKDTKETFMKALYADGIMGSISEIYDTQEPYLGKGTTAQGWSVAEVYRIILS